ncbi:MAG: type II toxin-antitoxin system RelE/ParE family toxin [Acidobacteriota bacterium]
MLRLKVRPEAEADALEAAFWYEGERTGLGIEFSDALRATFLRIEQSPLRFPLVSREFRRAIVSRFPFGVFFMVEGELVTVAAITHLHRHHSSWQERQ